MFLIRWFKRIFLVALVSFVLLWVVLAGFRYPNPIKTIQVGFGSIASTATSMYSNPIKASSTPVELNPGTEEVLPAQVEWYGKSVAFNDFLKATKTDALLIYRDGKLTHEWYADGVPKDRLHPSYSVAKSVTSIIAGQLIAEGKLSEGDLLIKILPEWKTGTSFDRITIGDLLDMRSGIDVPDNYPSGPSGWARSIAQMYATTDLNYFIKHHRKMMFEPGSKGLYRSVDTQMVGMALRKITGKSMAQLAQERIWQPIGAEHAASWSADKSGGIEKAFCCFNAIPRDYLRLGTLLLQPTTTLDMNWYSRISSPVESLDHNWGYGAFFWHPYPDTIMMLGLHEQIVMAVPNNKTVIVKLSENLQEKDEPETVRVLHEVATKRS